MEKLHVVTVATNSEFYFPYLEKSCLSNGVKLEVLGFGEKWEGFNWKYVKMIEYLKNIDPNDIVCFVDGYDVICTRNLNEIVEEYQKIKKNTNSKIIVAYGNNDNETLMSFYFGKCKNNLLNSGTYIGTAEDLLKILKEVYNLNPNNNADDQVLLTQYCHKYPQNVYVDIDNKLFLSLAKPLEELNDYVIIKDNNLYFNNQRPFFIHAPGGGYLDKLIINLGYNYDTSNPINNKLFNKIVNKIPYYTNRMMLDNFVIVVLIFLIFYNYFNWKIEKK